MASPAIIDITKLLEPISPDSPAGVDIRQDKSLKAGYTRIRDARKAARAAERNAVFPDKTMDQNTNWKTEASDNWRTIRELAPTILREHSKDLEIASWYTEALVRNTGFVGLRDGFKLIHGFIDNFWDDLHPVPDEDGMETRVSSLTGLNGEGSEGALISPMRSIPITEGTDPGPFSFWKYKQALDAERLTDEQGRSDVINKIGFSIIDFQKAVSNSNQDFYVNLLDDVSQALDEYKKIATTLNELCGNIDAPSTSNIIGTLTDIRGTILHVAQEKLPIEAADEDGDAEGATSGTSAISGPIKTRDDAFKQLSQISLFFRKTEPHSPIAYILDKAVNWGDMSLGELMEELIPDSGSRFTYSQLTGVKTSDD